MVRKIPLLVLSMVALGTVAVSGASAAATTTAAQWYTNGSSTPLSGVETLKVKTTKTFILKGLSGGTGFIVSSPESECIECTIVNTPVTEKPGDVAFGTGKIKIKSAIVTKPGNCKVVGGAITTRLLKIHADFMNGTTLVWEFVPVSGSILADFEIEGAACAVTGFYPLSGRLFGDASNATGAFAKEQPINLSPAIDTADGGALSIIGKPAELEGQGAFFLSSGHTFAVK